MHRDLHELGPKVSRAGICILLEHQTTNVDEAYQDQVVRQTFAQVVRQTFAQVDKRGVAVVDVLRQFVTLGLMVNRLNADPDAEIVIRENGKEQRLVLVL